jgi:DNA polymerase-1
MVQTIMGRKRYLSDINSANAVVRGVAERNAINAPIQGSAADIIKLAMINIWNEMRSRGLKSKMILQVHDELDFDVLKPELEQVKAVVKYGMENAVNIGLPLTVEMNAGENWLDAH